MRHDIGELSSHISFESSTALQRDSITYQFLRGNKYRQWLQAKVMFWKYQ